MKNFVEKPPNPPKSLNAEAKKWWRKLVEEYEISDPLGLLLLQTALEALDRLRDAQNSIIDDGVTVTDRYGQLRANPAVNIERDARAAMLAALKAMNLDLEPLRDRPGPPPGK